MMHGGGLPLWDDHRAACCRRIEQTFAPLKIVLVTKDDPFFIDRWIAHHIRIVGLDGLVILDNMSGDPRVLSVYAQYGDRLNVIRFSGPHNSAHHSVAFNELYAALASSSDYCAFIDTDEFLILIDGDRHHGGDQVLDFIMRNREHDLFPCPWLLNANWNATQFRNLEPQHLAHLLACGKPLIRSTKFPAGYVNHNFQLGTNLFRPPFKTGLFLLHLSMLNPQQRIAANVNKLISRQLVQPGEPVEAILARDDITDEVAAFYVQEIRDCLKRVGQTGSEQIGLGPGCIELLADGRIGFFSETERTALATYIADPTHIYSLISGRYRLDPLAD